MSKRERERRIREEKCYCIALFAVCLVDYKTHVISNVINRLSVVLFPSGLSFILLLILSMNLPLASLMSSLQIRIFQCFCYYFYLKESAQASLRLIWFENTFSLFTSHFEMCASNAYVFIL